MNEMQDIITEEYTLEIVPGILEKDWAEVEKKLEQAKGFAKTVHIDIIDGKFANNMTFMDPKPFAKYAKDLILEAHLMVEDPIRYVKPFGEAGFRRLLGHVEKMPSIADFVAAAQIYGEVGLSFDGPTNLTVLDKVNIDDLDALMIYTCERVGFSGAKFDEGKLEKVRQVHAKSMIPIEVDGGIKDTNILFAKSAGAVRFVATSFIWGAEDPAKSFRQLQSAVKSE